MGNIKIGICEWSLPIDGPNCFDMAKEVGLEGVQIDLGRSKRGFPLSKKIVQNLYLTVAKKNHLSIPSIAVRELDDIGMLYPIGSIERSIAEKAIMKAIDAANSMGIEIVMLPNFDKSDIRTKNDITEASILFRNACDLAYSKGIIIAVENLLSADDTILLFKIVNKPNFKLYFDSQNYYLNKGFDTPELLSNLIHLVCQVHLKDGKNGCLSGALLGDGDTNFYKTFEILKEYDYSGWVILENYYDQEPLSLHNDNPLELIKKDIFTIKRLI